MGKHGVVASFQQGPSWPLIQSKGADASNKGTDTANKGADNQNKGRASEPDADGDAVVRRIEANDAWHSRTAQALEHLRSPRSVGSPAQMSDRVGQALSRARQPRYVGRR